MSVNPEQNKSFMDSFIYVVIGISVVVILGGLSLIIFSDELAEEGVFGEGQLDFQDFETLAIEPGEDHYLACPEFYCSNSTPDETTKVYPVQDTELRNRLTRFVDRRDTVSIRKMDLASLDFVLLEYSGSSPFPDVIFIKLYDLGGSRSSAAIYSRTINGNDDRERNRERVKTWLEILEQP